MRLIGIFAVLATLALGVLSGPPAAEASAARINADVQATLNQFYARTPGARSLANRAAAILVFPTVVKAGFGIGGEYGEGALLVGGKTSAYYNIAAASIGFQLGAQARSQIVLFMTPGALSKFRNSKGWKAGVDGSVALATLGAGESIDSETAKKPIIGFIFSNKGLMYNLTFEGSKITKIER